MSTIRYNDYLTAVKNGTINLDSMYYNVKLVSDEYVPNEGHKPSDVDKYIIAALGVLTNDDIKKLSMSKILDRSKSLLKTGIEMFPDVIQQQIDIIISDPTKREKLKEIVMRPTDQFYEHQYWQDLKENGIGYFVFESGPDSILTFSEEVSL